VTDRYDVVIIGAGQAGLAVSHELRSAGVDHVVIERRRIAETWRGRWDSFCLVTPNWFINLPGGAYDGPDPDGFMPRDDIVAHMERYARSFEAPVREGVEVTRLRRNGDGFVLETAGGPIEARAVVLATGAYQRAHRPAGAAGLPPGIATLNTEDYRNPNELPPGRVLVVGSGQTGIQLAEELHEAGRDVVVACGRAPWFPRTIDGRDLVRWSLDIGFLDVRTEDLPSPAARLVANVQASGHGGGHDLHYRTLQSIGVTLAGRLAGADERHAYFAPDLADSVAFGDARYRDLRGLIEKHCTATGIPMPEVPDPPPFAAEPPESVDLSEFGAVMFTSGFRPDYESWVDVPGAFDDMGFPVHAEGASTVAPGLYFVGVHFLRKRKSTILGGVGEDATIVAAQVVEAVGAG